MPSTTMKRRLRRNLHFSFVSRHDVGLAQCCLQTHGNDVNGSGTAGGVQCQERCKGVQTRVSDSKTHTLWQEHYGSLYPKPGQLSVGTCEQTKYMFASVNPFQ